MKASVFSLTLVLFGTLGIASFGYSIAKQTAIQMQMNTTMRQIDNSIVATGALVSRTSGALTPLVATTVALEGVELHEKSTVNNLKSMNNYLRAIGLTEQNIIHGLDALNASTDGVTQELSSMQNLNHELQVANQSSVKQGRSESGQIENLNSMTQTSVSQMHRLNGKFAMLRVIP